MVKNANSFVPENTEKNIDLNEIVPLDYKECLKLTKGKNPSFFRVKN